MTDSERQALGVTLAGKNQYRVLASIMQNFAHAQEATTTALNASGSAIRENAAYMESLQAQTQLLKADFQTLANNVITKEFVSRLLDMVDGFLKLADTPIGRFVTQMLLLSGIGWGATSLLRASRIVPILTSQFQTFFTTITTGGIAISTTLPWLLLISGALVGISKIVKAINEEQEAHDPFNIMADGVERLNKSLSSIEDLQKIEDLISRYQELRDKAKLTAEEEQELDTIRQQLVDSSNGYIDSELDIGIALDNNIAKYQDYIEKLQEAERIKAKTAFEETKEGLIGAQGKLENSQQELDNLLQYQDYAYRIFANKDIQLQKELQDVLNEYYERGLAFMTDAEKDRMVELEAILGDAR